MPALTPLQRTQIRHARIVQNTPTAAVARRFGVADTTVHRIAIGRTFILRPRQHVEVIQLTIA